jgi:hypothetical protein
MTLAIKIGAGSQIYDNVALANSMRGYQKLSITGTGEEIKAALGDISGVAANVGSIKATNDLNLTVAQVDTYKAALVKLGTKSIVLDSGTSANNIKDYFNQLDAVYTKIKSITISPEATPTIAVEKLATAINLGGLETLTGKTFDVSGTAVTIKANMDSILKKESIIGKINIASGSEVQFTAAQLSILGDKLVKTDATSKVILSDTADRVLTTSTLSLINRLNNTNINAPSTSATVASVSGNEMTVTGGHGYNTGDAVTFNGTDSGGMADGTTYYARKLSNTTFSIYSSYANAVATSSTTGIVDPTGASTKTFISQVGNTPLRNTTLDSVKVTSASIDQANRLATLTAVIPSVTTPGAVNRALSNIISSVEIADTVNNLNAGGTVKAAASYTKLGAGSAITGYTGDNTVTIAGKITMTGNTFATGDAVTYTKTTGGFVELTTATTYYVGKDTTDANSFYLFTSKASALSADKSTATLAKTGGALSLATGQAPTYANNLFTSNDAGVINIVGHGYKTGDALTYSVDDSSHTKISDLTDGATYYAGQIAGSLDNFALFTSRSAALSADLSSANSAALGGAIQFANANTASAGYQQFTNSTLDAVMSAVSRFKDNNGNVGRVTIKGTSTAVTAATLNDIVTKALRGNSSANVAYSAKAVDISNNIQSLYDNNTVSTAKHLTEIVVTDGTATGKKGFSLSQTFYNALAPLFKGGADNPTLLDQVGTLTGGGPSATTNYITKSNHGYSTGDAVVYSATGNSSATGLTSGNTYYVGKLDSNTFVLFDTKAKAVANNLSDANSQATNQTNAYGTSSTNRFLSLGTVTPGTGTFKFTTGVQNKNYSFTVTNATFDPANPTALQNDSNISSYAVTNASYENLVIGNQLRIALGQSKLKSLTTQSISEASLRATITGLLMAIGSPVDRAKLKLTV